MNIPLLKAIVIAFNYCKKMKPISSLHSSKHPFPAPNRPENLFKLPQFSFPLFLNFLAHKNALSPLLPPFRSLKNKFEKYVWEPHPATLPRVSFRVTQIRLVGVLKGSEVLFEEGRRYS